MRERTSIVADATEVDESGLNQLGEVDPAELKAQKMLCVKNIKTQPNG